MSKAEKKIVIVAHENGDYSVFDVWGSEIMSVLSNMGQLRFNTTKEEE